MSSGTPHFQKSRQARNQILSARQRPPQTSRTARKNNNIVVFEQPEPPFVQQPQQEQYREKREPARCAPARRETSNRRSTAHANSAHQRRAREYSQAMAMRELHPVLMSVPTANLPHLREVFLTNYSRYQKQRSLRTIELRKMMIERLGWFLENFDYRECGVDELEHFFAYLTTGHEDPDGRWGYEGDHLSFKPLKPITILGYYRHLSSFFKWMMEKGEIDESPFFHVGVPEAQADQVIPFTDQEVESLLAAARHSGSEYRQRDKMIRLRDQAIILFLLSSGVRASELCGLKLSHVDFTGRRAVVLGKGNRHRQVPFGENAETMLRRYLNLRYPNPQMRRPDDVLFASEGTCSQSDHMNKDSLRQMFWRLGRRAGLHIPKCSPHTMRHTFALRCAENGWDVFRLKETMGHRDIKTTMIYVNLAHANPITQQLGYMPGDNLRI